MNRSSVWIWIIIIVLLLLGCIWLFTQLQDCQDELTACMSKPPYVPPPGTPIILDPNPDPAALTAWKIGGLDPNCIDEPGDFINDVGVGEVHEFSTTVGGVSVDVKKIKAKFKDGNGGTHTLIVERSSSGFNWKLDDTVLDSKDDYPTEQHWRNGLCGTLDGTIDLTYKLVGGGETTVPAEDKILIQKWRE
jgi:hypothetical protein